MVFFQGDSWYRELKQVSKALASVDLKLMPKEWIIEHLDAYYEARKHV